MIGGFFVYGVVWYVLFCCVLWFYVVYVVWLLMLVLIVVCLMLCCGWFACNGVVLAYNWLVLRGDGGLFCVLWFCLWFWLFWLLLDTLWLLCICLRLLCVGVVVSVVDLFYGGVLCFVSDYFVCCSIDYFLV